MPLAAGCSRDYGPLPPTTAATSFQMSDITVIFFPYAFLFGHVARCTKVSRVQLILEGTALKCAAFTVLSLIRFVFYI